MPKIKSEVMGSTAKARRTSKRGGGGAGFVKYIPANDSVTVRFLTEPAGWVGYHEHFDEGLNRSYPCIEGDCPGCELAETNERAKAKYKYLVAVVDREDDQAKPLLVPKSLANRLITREDKYGTLMDRDYELSKSGKGLDTEYDLDAQPKSSFNVGKYDLPDLEAVLEAQWEDVHGGDDEEEDEPRRPAKKAVGKKAALARKRASRHDDEDERPRRTIGRKVPAKKAVARKAIGTTKKAAVRRRPV